MTTHTPTARVLGLDRDEEDGALLLRARCETCRKTVVHSAGHDLDDVQLGYRVAHCDCDEYELVDPNNVVPLRLRTLRQQYPAFREHLAIAARARRIEEAEEDVRRAVADAGPRPTGAGRRLVNEAREALQVARVAVIDPAGISR